jgi:FKBP-type peptidyl-prolyl cis-trans isomerase FklB
MNKLVLSTIVLSSCFSLFAQKSTSFKKIDSVSYLIGNTFAENILRDFPEATTKILLQGMKDKLEGKKPMIEDPSNTVLSSFFQEKQAVKQKELDKLNEGNKLAGEQFLADIRRTNNKVKITPSGLQYEVIKEGEGALPISNSNVRVHYHGTTIDGKVFDSSVDRGEPINFVLNQVIPGWTEGVQLMKEGAKYRFYIPQELAYGENSPTASIKPFSALIFDVELIKIEK